MPYSNFSEFKSRPVLIFKIIDKNDLLILPLTTNLQRGGVVITKDDLKKGMIKKTSVVIVPKITAIDISLINNGNFIAQLKTKSYNRVLKEICNDFRCEDI